MNYTKYYVVLSLFILLCGCQAIPNHHLLLLCLDILPFPLEHGISISTPKSGCMNIPIAAILELRSFSPVTPATGLNDSTGCSPFFHSCSRYQKGLQKAEDLKDTPGEVPFSVPSKRQKHPSKPSALHHHFSGWWATLPPKNTKNMRKSNRSHQNLIISRC